MIATYLMLAAMAGTELVPANGDELLLVPLPKEPAANLPSFAFPLNNVTPVLPNHRGAGPGSPRELVDLQEANATRAQRGRLVPSAPAPVIRANPPVGGPTFTEVLDDVPPVIPIELDEKHIVDIPTSEAVPQTVPLRPNSSMQPLPQPISQPVSSTAGGNASPADEKIPLWKRLNPFRSRR